jgi:outer membrane protein OmpA-like peptidoglycan-associated protein
VATARKGLNFRAEARNEVTDQVGNWNYTVGVGWWPTTKAVRSSSPKSSAAPATPPPAPSTTSGGTTGGTSGSSTSAGGVSYTEAAALQSTIDRLTAENKALHAQAGGTPLPPPTPESRAAAQRAAFQRMATLSGNPGGFSETAGGVQFASEQFIGFPEGGAKLDAKDQEQIRRLAVLLMMFPGSTAVLEGHADSRGSVAANQKVTTSRATVVRQELIRLGVPSDAVTAQGIGATRPVADNATLEGRSANRRVSVRVTGAPIR